MGNLLNGKNKILEKQAGINSLYQDRCIIYIIIFHSDKCKERNPTVEM